MDISAPPVCSFVCKDMGKILYINCEDFVKVIRA
jgi:hypothetical protein